MHPHFDLAGKRFGRLYVLSLDERPRRSHNRHWQCVCICGATTVVRGSHLRSGSTVSCGCIRRGATIVAVPDYAGAHARVRRGRGKASDQRCIQCDERADHWAYDHMDPDEVISRRGLPYSLKSSHYQPMCVTCHNRLDKKCS